MAIKLSILIGMMEDPPEFCMRKLFSFCFDFIHSNGHCISCWRGLLQSLQQSRRMRTKYCKSIDAENDQIEYDIYTFLCAATQSQMQRHPNDNDRNEKRYR